MPELPEVETICRGIAPLIIGLTFNKILVRVERLRFPLPRNISEQLCGREIIGVSRRAKYLIIECVDDIFLIVHFGMSGTIRYLKNFIPFDRHDHVDFYFTGGGLIRFRDPRRFGAIILGHGDPLLHPPFVYFGPEPLSAVFSAQYFYRISRNRTITVKAFLMDQKIVVGVGNIYASEALFAAGIAPWVPAGSLSFNRCSSLVSSVKAILTKAITAGGTTLRDFFEATGKPGYFVQELKIYGRQGHDCSVCRSRIETIRLAGRSSCYCPSCQK